MALAKKYGHVGYRHTRIIGVPLSVVQWVNVYSPCPAHRGKMLCKEVLPVLRLTISQAPRDLAITRQVLHHILSCPPAVALNIPRRLEKRSWIPGKVRVRLQDRTDIRQLSGRADAGIGCIPSSHIAKRIGAVDGH
jgi:hypothetical protein